MIAFFISNLNIAGHPMERNVSQTREREREREGGARCHMIKEKNCITATLVGDKVYYSCKITI